MSIVTLKTRLIFQSEEDKTKLIQTLEASRKLFNEISKEHFSVNDKGYLNCKNNIKLLHNKVYRKIRDQYPEFKSQLVIKAEQAVLAAYRSIKSRGDKLEGPAVKKRLSLSLDCRLFSYKDEVLRITTLDKRVACSIQHYARLDTFLEQYKFGDISLSVDNNGDVWANLPFKIPDQEVVPKLALGIDVGIRRAAATSDGRIFIDKKYRKRLREIRYLKRKLASANKKKKSKSAKRHLQQLRCKEKNVKNNFVHHLVNALLDTKANVLVVEDLVVAKMMHKKHSNQNKRQLAQASMSRILEVLTYKAALRNKVVVRVNPKFTSQTDSVTDKREGNRVGCRFYSASGLIYDSDVNASVCIAKRANLPYLGGNILEGQATVTWPIVVNS